MKVSQLGLALAVGVALTLPPAAQADSFFDQTASFLVCENTSCEHETSSEIIAASADGNTLVYSDSPGKSVGLIDISDQNAPAALGAIDLSAVGEPTSVAVFTGTTGAAATEYLLVAINTSPDFGPLFDDDHSGYLYVFELAACIAKPGACNAVATLDLGEQPDSVAVSPNGNFIAIAVENERDEEASMTRPACCSLVTPPPFPTTAKTTRTIATTRASCSAVCRSPALAGSP
jgi:hypothetical protein